MGKKINLIQKFIYNQTNMDKKFLSIFIPPHNRFTLDKLRILNG